MSLRALDAASAYAGAMGRGLGAPGAEAAPTGAASFGEMVEAGFSKAVEASRSAEVSAAKGLASQADLVDVVAAVNNAELALETVVAVRDRMITAYQEILRMPI
jgi:flagellar hook-basal body complex protein FliE